MKKTAFLCNFLYMFALVVGFLFIGTPLNAQVDRAELGDLGPVEFINYVGPYSRIETSAQIRGIGNDLGQAVRNGASRTGGLGRYFIIHSVSEPDGNKLDADIMGLGVDVAVDHIRNLRLIIQGYLEAAYDYTERDAALLAEYITIYNAVYRGDWNFFSSRYKNPVMSHLTREKAGLAIRYDEWPGQTLMLIPLGTGLGGPLSTIDTTTLGDSRVTEQLRQEPDMGLDQRRDMVDLLEREADQASHEATITREAIREEEERIAREREQAEREIQQINGERQQPDADQQELDRQEQEALERQQELAEREAALEEQRELAEQQEAFAEQKSEEAQEQRQLIAEDQQAMIDREPPPALVEGLLGVSIVHPASSLGRLVLLDNSGREIRQSPLNTINARTVIQISNRIFAIAGVAQGSGAIRLVEINNNTLEMVKQGDDDISSASLLWSNGTDLYALTGTDANPVLARFNTDLVLQSRSAINVHPQASVFIYGNNLLTQRDNGAAVLLNPQDLSELR